MKLFLLSVLFFISILSNAFAQTSSCPGNLDFENGNFGNWTGYVGYNNNSAGNLIITGTGIINGALDNSVSDCQFQTLIDTNYSIDPYGNFPGVAPNCSNYSARLGGDQINLYQGYCNYVPYQDWSYSSGEIIENTFTVVPGNAVFMYMFAVVLESTNHPVGSGPYFRAEMLDTMGNSMNTCFGYYAESSINGAPLEFSISASGAAYLPWKGKIVDLTSYIGQTVTLRFTAAGCAFGGDWGYAYVDVTCCPLITETTNPCNDTVYLTAPDVINSTYSWSGPSIVGSDTSQIIQVNAAGIYSVTITSGLCSMTLSITVSLSPTLTLSATGISPTCVSCNNGIIDLSTSGGTPGYSYNIHPLQGFLAAIHLSICPQEHITSA